MILEVKLNGERHDDFFGLHVILGGNLDVERRADLFFGLQLVAITDGSWTSGSVETATKLLGFGRLARVKKHWFKRRKILFVYYCS